MFVGHELGPKPFYNIWIIVGVAEAIRFLDLRIFKTQISLKRSNLEFKN